MMDLKPCWCGGAARRVDIDDESENAGASFIECTRCGNTTNLEFGRKENLLDRWNTRPREDALQAEVDELKAILAAYDTLPSWSSTDYPAASASLMDRRRAALKGAPHE